MILPKPLFRGAAIRVDQRIGTFWAAAVPASVLLKCTVPDRLRVALDPQYEGTKEWRHALHMLGNQRKLEETRLRQIAKYIDSIDSTFPNSIIVAAPTEESADSKGKPWSIEQKGDGCWELVIPSEPLEASVVDGQHRLYSFVHSSLEDRQDFNLLCSFFFDIPSSVQALIFATINTNQRAVRRGMALNLYGYNVEDEEPEHWSPEKLAVFLVRRLNFDPESKLYRRVKIEAEGAPKPEFLPGATRVVPLAALADGILKLISKKPKDDREELKSERVLFRKKRNELPNDGTPLRLWYTQKADRQIYELLRTFVAVVDKEIWSHARERWMLTRAVGVRAIFYFLADFLEEQKPASPKGEAKQGQYEKILGSVASALADARDIDFTDPFFEPTGRGQVRILRALLLRAERFDPKTVEDDAEREELVRLVARPKRKT